VHYHCRPNRLCLLSMSPYPSKKYLPTPLAHRVLHHTMQPSARSNRHRYHGHLLARVPIQRALHHSSLPLRSSLPARTHHASCVLLCLAAVVIHCRAPTPCSSCRGHAVLRATTTSMPPDEGRHWPGHCLSRFAEDTTTIRSACFNCFRCFRGML
jgi:hypothetical protein